MQTAREPRHSIGVVTRATGLTAEVVRVWEKRYGAVSPQRTSGGHRLYSEADIARLKVLCQATQRGYRIGTIVALSTDQLCSLLDSDLVLDNGTGTAKAAGGVDAWNGTDHLGACLDAIKNLDKAALQSHLESALVELGHLRFVEELVTPLMAHAGDYWENGEIRPFHEHMASVVIRSILYSHHINSTPSISAPTLIVTTPPGQMHELGALSAALAAESDGWRVLYFGSDLPIEDIAMAARQSSARAVALSVCAEGTRSVIAQDFQKLRRLLGDAVAIIVGGRAVTAFSDAIAQAKAKQALSLSAFRDILRTLLADEAEHESSI